MSLSFNSKKRMKGINIIKHTYLYSAYTDGTTRREKWSVQELNNVFATFLEYSGLKPNRKKCEMQVSDYVEVWSW